MRTSSCYVTLDCISPSSNNFVHLSNWHFPCFHWCNRNLILVCVLVCDQVTQHNWWFVNAFLLNLTKWTICCNLRRLPRERRQLPEHHGDPQPELEWRGDPALRRGQSRWGKRSIKGTIFLKRFFYCSSKLSPVRRFKPAKVFRDAQHGSSALA